MMPFENRVAIVTGGASGIGRATAELFAKSGAAVVIADISAKNAEMVAHELTTIGCSAIAIQTNVGQESEVEKMVAQTCQHYGRLDYAANVAGLPQSGGLFCDREVRDSVLQINLMGAFYSVAAEVKAMRMTGGGAIVNCASINGFLGAAECPFYAATKHGLIGFTKSVALEVANERIRVNAVCPGLTRSAMAEEYYGDSLDAAGSIVPLGRISEAQDQAKAMVWLCSDDAAFITGTTLTVDGGQSAGMLPAPSGAAKG